MNEPLNEEDLNQMVEILAAFEESRFPLGLTPSAKLAKRRLIELRERCHGTIDYMKRNGPTMVAPCGRIVPHPAHTWIRARKVYRCEGIHG